MGSDHGAVSRAADGRWLVDAGAEVVDAGGVVLAAAARAMRAFRLKLEALPSGQVGVFPEQRENWAWISRQVAKTQATLGRAPRVLNLFAYTGGSTLAAAAAGAEVVHIDAVQTIVDRAKENAAFSGFAEKPVRWIAEDAVKFCRRELKRGNQYDGVILDPPSYGHGPKGEPWKIDTDLLPLLTMCGELTAENRGVRARLVPFARHRTGGALGVSVGRHLRPLRPAAGRRANSRWQQATAANCRPACSRVGRT